MFGAGKQPPPALIIFRAMHRFFIKIPWWVKRLFPAYVWSMPAAENTVYLTFDDGPHPEITPWVLGLLQQYNARATFFCIGDNVAKYPAVFNAIAAAGHAVGNHTYNHLNGWKSETETYLQNIALADGLINSSLFRPPYGRIKKAQASRLSGVIKKNNVKVIMWDVLSADFDTGITTEQCTNNVLKHVKPGSIVVFHDSDKAYFNLKETLPAVLQYIQDQGFRMEAL